MLHFFNSVWMKKNSSTSWILMFTVYLVVMHKNIELSVIVLLVSLLTK